MKNANKWPRIFLATILMALGTTSSHAQEAKQAAATVSTASESSIANDPDVQAATRLFSAWMEGQLLYKSLPGVAVGVVSDQQLVWSKGFGYADVKAKVPMTPSTKFRIASHSKLFNAVAIMQLREEGKLRLDDPVSRYLPWFKPRPAGDDDGTITIEQLITHTSGLQREAGDHWTSYNFPTREELKALFAGRQAAFPPATRHKYSNLAVSIAGLVVEEASGLPWEDYVARNIFEPLGMTASSVDRDVAGLAVPYGRRMPDGSREQLGFVAARGMTSATGVTSTVEDLAKFVSAQFRKGPRGGPRILSSGSLREMHRVRSVEESWASGYGLGFAFWRLNNRTYIGHTGGYPGNMTITYIQLDDNIGVIVLTNYSDAEREIIAQQLLASVGQAVFKSATPKRPADEWDPSWSRFAGIYRGRGADVQVVVLNKRLTVITLGSNAVESSFRLEPIGGGRFKYMAPTGGSIIGEVVRFVEEPGKPMRMYTGDSWVDRMKE